MKAAAFALSLALILSLASASGFSACFPPPSALGFSVENASYPGSFGNYTVYVQSYPPPSLIRVDGPDAGQNALIGEIQLLEQSKMLETPCNITRVQMYSYMNYACSPEGAWQDEDQAKLCGHAETDAMGAGQNLPSAAKETADANSPPALPAPARADFNVRAEKGSGAPESAAPQGIAIEQLLPLFAGFLAVVVLSYLVLQQRQETVQIDPQEERLLSNETRAGIMSELSQSDKIPTDLSMKLGKSKATVVEHLEALVGAGFVERVATPGRKFVFYRLTQKGKRALLRRAG